MRSCGTVNSAVWNMWRTQQLLHWNKPKWCKMSEEKRKHPPVLGTQLWHSTHYHGIFIQQHHILVSPETTVSRTNVLLHCELLNFTGGLRNLDNKITVSTVACSLVLHVFAVMICSFCCLRLLALAFRLNISEQLPSEGCLFPHRDCSVTVAAVLLWDLQTALGVYMNVPVSNVGSNLMRFLFSSYICHQRWPPADSLRFPRFESSPRVSSYVAFLLPRKAEFGAKNDVTLSWQ